MKKIIIVISAIAVVSVSVWWWISVYNSPMNQLEREREILFDRAHQITEGLMSTFPGYDDVLYGDGKITDEWMSKSKEGMAEHDKISERIMEIDKILLPQFYD